MRDPGNELGESDIYFDQRERKPIKKEKDCCIGLKSAEKKNEKENRKRLKRNTVGTNVAEVSQ